MTTYGLMLEKKKNTSKHCSIKFITKRGAHEVNDGATHTKVSNKLQHTSIIILYLPMLKKNF